MAGTELAELAAAVKSTTAEELQKALQDMTRMDGFGFRV